MHRISLRTVLQLHHRIIASTGGEFGIRNLPGLQSALAQPRMTFGGEDLYPSIVDKASALGFSLIQNHPFVDGNKRAGHAVMELFLYVHGYEIDAPVEEQEQVMLQVASGEYSQEELVDWLRQHLRQRTST